MARRGRSLGLTVCKFRSFRQAISAETGRRFASIFAGCALLAATMSVRA
jgi:hypothetical protein